MAIERAARDDESGALTLRGQRLGVPMRALLPLIALALVALAFAGPPRVFAADPTADPAARPRPPTCSERFPEEGPAGIDLRLGCIVGEVAGVYTTAQAALPAPLSTYAILLGIVIASSLLLLWIAGRLIAQRAGRRLAPTLAAEWWICATCKSVNGANVARCYSCGSTRPEGATLVTDDNPHTPQSFGSTRKRG